jgi:hypothetical protein
MIKRHKLNMEIGGRRINDVASKLGGLFGNTGRKIGRAIDNGTKNVTIKIENNNSISRRSKSSKHK